MVFKSTKIELFVAGKASRTHDWIIEGRVAVIVSEENTKCMFGIGSRAAVTAADTNACVGVKIALAAVRIEKFNRSRPFPKSSVLGRIHIDPGCRVKEILEVQYHRNR